MSNGYVTAFDRTDLFKPVPALAPGYKYLALPPTVQEGEVGEPLLTHHVERGAGKDVRRTGLVRGLNGWRTVRAPNDLPFLVRSIDRTSVAVVELVIVKVNSRFVVEVGGFLGGGGWTRLEEIWFAATYTEIPGNTTNGTGEIEAPAAAQMAVHSLQCPAGVVLEGMVRPDGVVHWQSHRNDPATEFVPMMTMSDGGIYVVVQ